MVISPMSYFNSNNGARSNRNFGGGHGRNNYKFQDRQMHSAVCDNCGQDCQVPFKPDGSKPIYCSKCFEKNQTSGDNRNRPKFSDNNKNNDLLASINSKLEKIISLLSEYKPCACETTENSLKPAKKSVKKKAKV